MLHSEDIIDEEEEELEESCDEQKLKSLQKLSARKQQKVDRAGSMLNQDIVGLPKVTPEELLEFAVVRHPTQSSNEEIKSQYEVQNECNMFERTKQMSEIEFSMGNLN